MCLSPREQEIIDLVAEGKMDIQIAHELQISDYTVATHMRRIFAKLKARNRAHAVAKIAGYKTNGP